jgi:hypothetical protein
MWKTWTFRMTFVKNVQGWLRACVYTLDRHTSPMANDVVAVFKPRALPGPQVPLRTLCSCGLQLCSAVRGSLSSLVLILNTEILVLSIEGRTIITQRLLDGRFFHDEFA